MNSSSKFLGEQDLVRKMAKAGTGHKITVASPDPEDRKKILSGKFEMAPIQMGFGLHTWEGRELEDAVASIDLSQSVVFSIVLEGRLRFSIDGKEASINEGADSNGAEIGCKNNDKQFVANCFAMNLVKPACLKRIVRKGAQMRKLNISVDPRYLAVLADKNIESDAPISYFLACHLELPTWQASDNLVQIAEQILKPPMAEGVLRKLYLESKAREFVIGSLQAISEIYSGVVQSHRSRNIANPLYSKSKAGKIKTEIDRHLMSGDTQQDEKCLEKIALSVGMSVSSLQRVFKKNFGQTVVVYVRLHRLGIARKAIEDENVSIGEAAYIAGYKHTSNFSIAFKRTFGISPGALCQP